MNQIMDTETSPGPRLFPLSSENILHISLPYL
jgi:hypothetical protein